MPSALEDAFEEALDAAAEVKGLRETVTFRGETLDALIHDDMRDFDYVAGGQTTLTPIRLDLRTSDVTLPIENLEAIIVRGIARAVLTWAPLANRIAITAGDPAAAVD